MTLVNSPVAARLRDYRRKAWESVLAVGDPSRIPNQAYAKMNATLDWRVIRERVSTPAKRIEYARNAVRFGGLTPNPADRMLYADSFDALHWREVGTAEEVSQSEGSRRIKATGYYVDESMSETVIGHVLQLPGRSGSPQYVAAVSWSDRDGVTVWPCRITDEKMTAAIWADQEAERIGEEEREYSQAYEAGRRYAEKIQEARETREERRTLHKALKAQRAAAIAAGLTPSPVVCQTLREKLNELYREGRRAYDKAEALLNDYPAWSRPKWADSYQETHGRDPFPNGNPEIDRLADAFRTGASDAGVPVPA